MHSPPHSKHFKPVSPSAAESDEEDTPLATADITTSAEFALLKGTHNELEVAQKAASEKEQAEWEQRKTQPGYDSDDDYEYLVDNTRESRRLSRKIWAMRLPQPEPLMWALVELSADFKRAHLAGRLAKFKVSGGREWFNDGGDLISESIQLSCTHLLLSQS